MGGEMPVSPKVSPSNRGSFRCTLKACGFSTRRETRFDRTAVRFNLTRLLERAELPK